MIMILGAIFALFMVVLMGAWSGGFSNLIGYIDFSSILLIGLPVIFFFCVTQSGKPLRGYIKSSLQKVHEYDTKELELIALSAKNAVKITLASGAFGFLTGLIIMMANISELDALGAGLSISLLSIYYAVIVAYSIFFPVQAWAQLRVKDREL